jgi:ribose transport system substrate-binding protein
MRKSRIGLTSAALMAVAGLTLAGCAAAEEETATDAAETTEEAATNGGETYEVYALLPQGNDQAYGTRYVPTMEAKAAELGINLTITNSEYDGDKQAAECEVAVAAQPDGIILWPAIADTIRPCLEAADAAGIPVWVTNSDVNPEDAPLTYGYSGTDSYGQGAASAEIMCEIVDGADIGIIQINGVTGNSVATLRGNGFSETIAAECPNVTILAEQPGDWLPEPAQIAASEMLTSVGVENVQGMYAADDSMIKGGIDALKARDLDPADFFITSIGNTFLGNPLVVRGELRGTIFQSSSWDGENAVVGIYRAMTGETSQGRDDEGSVVYMPNPKVTAANASDPEVAPEW